MNSIKEGRVTKKTEAPKSAKKKTTAPAKPARKNPPAAKVPKTPAKKAKLEELANEVVRSTRKSARKAAKTPAKQTLKTPKSKISKTPALDRIGSDVKIVLEKLENTPAAKALLQPEDIFDRLEQVSKSPKRVDIVCKQILNESKSEEEDIITPPEVAKRRTPALTTSKRMTRSAKKTTTAIQRSKLSASLLSLNIYLFTVFRHQKILSSPKGAQADCFWHPATHVLWHSPVD